MISRLRVVSLPFLEQPVGVELGEGPFVDRDLADRSEELSVQVVVVELDIVVQECIEVVRQALCRYGPERLECLPVFSLEPVVDSRERVHRVPEHLPRDQSRAPGLDRLTAHSEP